MALAESKVLNPIFLDYVLQLYSMTGNSVIILRFNSPGTTTPLELLATATGTRGILTLVRLLDYLANFPDYAIQIKPAVIGFNKTANFMQHIGFALVLVVCLEFYYTFIVIYAAFFGVDDF